jgi:hypothetical protein
MDYALRLPGGRLVVRLDLVEQPHGQAVLAAIQRGTRVAFLGLEAVEELWNVLPRSGILGGTPRRRRRSLRPVCLELLRRRSTGTR